MPVCVQRDGQSRWWLWHAWSQGHVWAAFVIMWNPFVQQASQVARREWYQKIQALPPQRADEPLAERIGLGTLGRRFENPEPKVADAPVELLGENAVAIMQQKTVAVVSRDRFAQLLRSEEHTSELQSQFHLV